MTFTMTSRNLNDTSFLTPPIFVKILTVDNRVKMNENTIMSNQYSNLDSSRQEIPLIQPPPRIINTSDTGEAEIDHAEKKGGGVIGEYYKYIHDEIGVSVTTFVDTGGNSALHIAVSKNDQFFASRLLDAGVDPNIVNHSGVTPLKIAIRMQFFEMAELLFKHGAVAGDDNVIKDFKSLQKNTVHIDEDLEYIDQFRARKSAVTRNSLSNSTPSDSFQRALKSHVLKK